MTRTTPTRRTNNGSRKPCFRVILTLSMLVAGARSFVAPRGTPRPRVSLTERIRVVGGGLAGLSVTYHLLQKSRVPLEIVISDVSPTVGTGGASAVAGGLMHPLSPRGKLVHWGLEGLAATNRLVQAARVATETGTDIDDKADIILGNKLYRIAESDQHVTQLQHTATALPELVQWLDADAIFRLTGCHSMGGLRLSNGCCVLHVPSYLQGLWKACQDLARERNSTASWTCAGGDPTNDLTATQTRYDATVFCGGAGMLTNDNRDTVLAIHGHEATSLPAQLVRGQSLEMRLPQPLPAAVLCGKYISPLPHRDPCRVLVGATHEFQTSPMSQLQVVAELQSRTGALSSLDWTKATVERVTCGYRVQSVRGQYGRRPMIGRVSSDPSSWIFTGLGSRGLLYHGLYGEMLADAILKQSEDSLLNQCPDILWWKQ